MHFLRFLVVGMIANGTAPSQGAAALSHFFLKNPNYGSASDFSEFTPVVTVITSCRSGAS